MRVRIAFTAGVFDLLHRGHIETLRASAALGDVLVVGVITDEGTQAYKGRRPIEHLQARMDNVRRLMPHAIVVEQKGTDPTELLERFRPNVMTHGSDWSRLRQGHETLERLGVEWVLLPIVPGISTTILRAISGGARNDDAELWGVG